MRGRKLGWTIAAIGAVTLTGILFVTLVAKPSAEANGYGCDLARLGTSIGEPARLSNGHETPEEAVRAAIGDIEQDRFEGDGDRMRWALDQRQGPDRFDPATSKLYLDDTLHVAFGLTQFEDGTWVSLNYTYCMRPPDS